MASMGYHSGLVGGWRKFPMFAIILAFAAVIWLIADLDRPQAGLIRVSHAALIDLQRNLQNNLTEAPTGIHEKEAKSP
jgi:hypothetical protein